MRGPETVPDQPAAGTFAPVPAGGTPGAGRMATALAGLELRLLARNGEQLLLTLVIPTLLLVLLTVVDVVDTGQPGRSARVDFLTPGMLALAVMSTAFTGQAIGTGYDRRYGALKWLGSTPLPRGALVAGKSLAVLAVETVQVVLLLGVAVVLGFSPGSSGWPLAGSVLAFGLLLLAGTAAFSALGLLMAGTLRAETTLAAANLVWVLLLLGGDIVVPVEKFGPAVAAVLELGPAAALAGGFRAVLAEGAGLPIGSLAVLLVWAAVGTALAVRTFRWE